jgi:phosphoribosylglycinamide formyltransferase-1
MSEARITDLESKSQNQALKQIAIFASGAGTNAQNISRYFAEHRQIKVKLIVSNKAGAGVLDVARQNGIDWLVIEKEKFFRDGYTDELREAGIDFIILAGFLLKVPQVLVDYFRGKIINIHPALLPNYGGKGMYGLKVHEAVIAAGDNESGITIHYVDEHYDNGDIIFQAKCNVLEEDTPGSLAYKIHKLEYAHFPKIIEECVLRDNK